MVHCKSVRGAGMVSIPALTMVLLFQAFPGKLEDSSIPELATKIAVSVPVFKTGIGIAKTRSRSMADRVTYTGNLVSLGNGEATFKSYVAMHFTGHGDLFSTSAAKKDKMTTYGTQLNPSKLDWELKTGYRWLGENARPMLAKSTVYGGAAHWSCSITDYSQSGLDFSNLTTDGSLNFELLKRKLKMYNSNAVFNDDVITKFVTNFIIGNSYENYVPLYLTLMIKALRIEMAQLNENHPYEFQLTAGQLQKYRDDGWDKKQVAHDLEANGHFGVRECNPALNVLICNFKTMLQSMASSIEGETTTFEVRVWHMHSYSDGHNTSSENIGDCMDFVNGRYLAFEACPIDVTEAYIQPEPFQYPKNEDECNSFTSSCQYLQGSGLTSEELTMLEDAFYGNDRISPFLVDQHIPKLLNRGTKVHIWDKKCEMARTANAVPADYRKLIMKLVRNTSSHEDLCAAWKIMRFWVAQPRADTVEAHWWYKVKRSQNIPSLGMRRGAIPFLIKRDNAYGITKDKKEIVDHLSKNMFGLLYISSFYNAAWYWGEYMMSVNKSTDEYVPTMSANATVAAMTGESFSIPWFEDRAPRFVSDLNELVKEKFEFGRITTDFGDYPYVVYGTEIISNVLPPPGAVGFVLGLSGSLIEKTPYASKFRIGPPEVEIILKAMRRWYKYHDMWALGVAARWQGYDITYSMRDKTALHVMHAPNNGHIALPPIPQEETDYVDDPKYRWRNTAERQMVQGYFFYDTPRYIMEFSWQVGNWRLLESNDYKRKLN